MEAEVLVVLGACGGIGASTTAALLARERAADGRRVALVDLGTHGGVDVLLGIEAASGVRWPDLTDVRGVVEPELLDGILPRWEGVEVLSAGRTGAVVAPTAVEAVGRALETGCDTVVVDCPSHGWPAPWPSTPDDVLLVTSQDVQGVAGALAVRPHLPAAAQLVLRRRRRPRVSVLEAAHLLDLPLLGTVPTDRALPEAVDRGLGPVVTRWSRLGRAVHRIAAGVGRG